PIMITVHDHPDLGRIELVKGAPELVVDQSSELDDADRAALLTENAAMAARGLRVLALASRRINDEFLHFAALVGLRDPPRPGAREAITAFSQAGIRTLMLTGDQRLTAHAVGHSLRIAEGDIYSRITPEAKLDIVRDLQQRGFVVAMSGDGVN